LKIEFIEPLPFDEPVDPETAPSEPGSEAESAVNGEVVSLSDGQDTSESENGKFEIPETKTKQKDTGSESGTQMELF
jgi:hypothetical protein